MRIGIIVAMEKELVQLRTLLDESTTERHHGKDFILGKIGQNDIIMQQCGIGKVNSAVGCVEMIHAYSPELIISTGVAGGTDVSMNVTEVVAGTQYVYHDTYCGKEVEYGQLVGMPPRFKTPKNLIEKALSVECGTPVHAGLIVSGDWFVDSKDKMLDILGHFPEAKAVDMESGSIAHTCYLYHVPFISFRIISDIPLKDTDASQYFDFWNRLAEGSFNVTKEFLKKL